MTAAELKQQLELAVDIEDWEKVKQIEARIERLQSGSGYAQSEGRGGYYGSSGGRHHQANWNTQPSSARSRSPRGGRHQETRLDNWYHQQHPSQPSENPVVIEYNKSIKHHLQKSQIQAAKGVLAEMQYTGIRPTSVTYNEFLNFYAKSKDVAEALRVVAEMRRQCVAPNRVSASTILKALGERPMRDHVDEVVNILRWVSSCEGMDEILLSSIAEATVRMGQHASKLYAVLRRELDEQEGRVWSAQTCGSLIRAHGHTKDVDGMWKMWNSMMSNRIRPTVVTTGCMVEQLVLNGQVNAADDLVRGLEGSGFSECVNSVVYYSLIKGYAMEKLPHKVWEVYGEMRLRRLQTSVTTYNGLVGAFSESGLTDKVSVLFQQMKSEGLTPTVCTYSRLAKGYCIRGDVKGAFEQMEQMRANTDLKPDEIFYNTLLDACAEQGLVDDGLKLLARMEQEHVASSKYTMSILAKLLVRAGRVGDALDQVESLSLRTGVEISTNIYTTLLGACGEFGDHLWASSILKTLQVRRCRPDRRVFTALLKRFLMLGSPAEALEAVRDVLEAVENSRTLQGIIDRQVLMEAMTTRATNDGADQVRPLLQQVSRATDGGFWFDLDAAVQDGGTKPSLGDRGGEAGQRGSRLPPPPPPPPRAASAPSTRVKEEADGGPEGRPADVYEADFSPHSRSASPSRAAGRGPRPSQTRASGSPEWQG
eukprot:CAMPEP_0171184294 /NCGR_PEP_ID=MMETSP0790-20130122/15716_1 /TAXON_ID=2925 /ORGANISM="Alexandrium catenella, Strain OF101" /LENGTH=706 /DNA_ID=CAMNT_0011649289 /DNA_START=71 /DNA_END=2187 /DNA_ORIENTATION=-